MEGTCSSTEAQPTHRPGQGSRLASALLMTFICNCFSAMLKLCHGVSFCDPSRNKLTHRQTSDVTHWFNFGPPHSLLNEVSMQDIASLQANQLNSLLLQTEAHTMILDSSDGKLQLAVRYFGNAKDRPLDSNLDPLEPSLTDLFPLFCFFKCTPSTTPSPSIQTQTTASYATANHCSLKRLQ